tara:strand:- start:3442 stop:3612 length:171 start_codon:yes stop_codon:yes gene_type:complete
MELFKPFETQEELDKSLSLIMQHIPSDRDRNRLLEFFGKLQASKYLSIKEGETKEN